MLDESQEQGVEVEGIEEGQEAEQQQAGQTELEEITIDEPEPPTGNEEGKDSKLVRELRDLQRESSRRAKALERELAETKAKLPEEKEEVPAVGARPTLEQYDFDTEAYETALENFHAQKSARAAYEAKQRNAQEDAQMQERKIVENYRAKADALPVDKAKFKAAEDEVRATFNPMQLAVLLKSPIAERLVMAIGNNPAKLDAISKLTDPIDLAMELGRTEKQLTSTKQTKSAPPPDRPLGGVGSGPADTALERLEEEAMRTGNRTKVVAYKKQKASASK